MFSTVPVSTQIVNALGDQASVICTLICFYFCNQDDLVPLLFAGQGTEEHRTIDYGHRGAGSVCR